MLSYMHNVQKRRLQGVVTVLVAGHGLCLHVDTSQEGFPAWARSNSSDCSAIVERFDTLLATVASIVPFYMILVGI